MNKESSMIKYVTYKKETPKEFIFDGSRMRFHIKSLLDGANKVESNELKINAMKHIRSFMPLEINAAKDMWFNIDPDGLFKLVDKDLVKKDYCLAASEQSIFNYFAFLFYYEFWGLLGYDAHRLLFVDCLAGVIDNSRNISYLFAITTKLNKHVCFRESDCKGRCDYGG